LSRSKPQKSKKQNSNSPLTVRKVRRGDEIIFLSLIDALADYEKLKRPSPQARRRLIRDGFGKKKRFDAYLAFRGSKAVGYAIVFETYSSFLALPTLYLEDIFISPDYRSQGIGWKLFRTCVKEAKRRGCGRMEWVVLDWNVNAIRFYKNIGARRLIEWQAFRLDKKSISSILLRR
jgi:GNAT superfamily N-acetyltransferase